MCSEQAIVRQLGRRDYSDVWQAMQAFTDGRDADTPDEFWVVEHPPVYTQGQAGKPEHLLNAHGIPVVQTDRGGQITYHGPGQIVIYTLCNLRRCGKGVRAFVSAIEDAIIATLADYGVASANRPDAPGVYVGDSKIAALGLRVRHGNTYHGLSLNVDMDLSPFDGINPCGYAGLRVTQTRDQGVAASMDELSGVLIRHLHDTIYSQAVPAVDTTAAG
ncbi:lipoyl(octanoyl) transferase LipB [Granulosicoccaceae sp. 1_MG-2023]|nr:lipoyl(octanoyl) transferase LipB [Granulosicoccaceae sp. 1_MG-2023]